MVSKLLKTNNNNLLRLTPDSIIGMSDLINCNYCHQKQHAGAIETSYQTLLGIR
ncbi:hypothetical protein R50073_24910 [Maricurvus nonylphenolicus]